MATVAQVAKAALQRILVQASEAALEPDEYQDFIFAMNNYMAQLDAQGVTLGYTEVSDLGDEVTVPTGALRGIIANMAIEVAPDYGGVVSEGLVKAAREGMQTMRTIGVRMGKTQPNPGAFPLVMYYPDNYASTNSNVTQRTDLTERVFWNTSGPSNLK